MVCCINDATETRSLTYSFRRPLWCNISPASKPTMQQTLLANLFLLQATVLVMQHLSLRNHGVLHRRCNKPSPLTRLFCRPPWCNISRNFYPASKSRCVASTMQQTLAANLFLPHATTMQHLLPRNHSLLHQRCDKPSLLIHSSCRHSDATSLSAHKFGPFLWSGGALQHRCNKPVPPVATASYWTQYDATLLLVIS